MSPPAARRSASRPLDPAALPLAGLTLIEASAGTGKTYTITTLYLRLILEKGLGIDQILVVTFTRAATVELRDRIRARVREAHALLERAEAEGCLPPVEDQDFARILKARLDVGSAGNDRARLAEALRGIDEAAILTIHGFCQRVLQEHAFECGLPYNAELLEDESGLRREVAYDFWASRAYRAPAFLVRHLRASGLGPDDLVRWAKDLAHLGIARLEPSRPKVGPEDLERAVRRWRAAFEPVAEGWRKEGPAIIDLLARGGEGPLNKGTYKPDAIREQWAGAMDEALSLEEPGIERRFDKFKNFGSEMIAKKTNKNGVSPEHPFFEACQRLLEAEAGFGEQLDAECQAFRHDFLEYFEREMALRKRRWNKLSFGDQLRLLHDALSDAQGRGANLVRAIRRSLKAALVDEFQDTDRLQYEIFRRIFVDAPEDEADGANSGAGPGASNGAAPPPLLLIGDPKQAIYGFRGADIFAYLEAVREAGERRYTLERNWRSDPGLIDAVNQLFDPSRAPAPFVFDEIDYAAVRPRDGARDRLVDPEGKPLPALQFLHLSVGEAGIPTGYSGKSASANKKEVERRLPRLIAGAIAASLNAGHRIVEAEGEAPVAPGDIAVLVRTNDQGRAMQAALRERGLPCVLHSETSVLDSEDAEVAERILAALIDPSDAGALRVALASDWVGWTASDLIRSAEDGGPWLSALEDVQEWRALWRSRGVMPALRALLQEWEVPARILSRPDGERRLTDILHLAELLHSAERRWRLGPEPLLRWLRRVIDDPAARSDIEREAAEMRLERDEASIQIVTVHKSKGLEYPIVYCPYLWSEVRGLASKPGPFTYHRSEGGDAAELVLDIGGEADAEARSAVEREALAEDLRLLYVAVTRARHRCVIVWGRVAGGARSALGYLLHPPQEPDRPDRWAASQARIAACFEEGDAAVERALRALVDAADGALALKALGASDRPRPRLDGRREDWRSAAADPPRVGARRFRGTIERGWSLSSFSGLKARAVDVAAMVERGGEDPLALEGDAALDAGRDHDERVERPESLDSMVRAESVKKREGASERVPLADFPAGPDPGTFLHEVFEAADFQGSETQNGRDNLATVIRQRLPRHGFDLEEWGALLGPALEGVLDTPLTPGRDLRLRDLGSDQRLDEMEFALPLSPEGGPSLSPGRLSRALLAGRVTEPARPRPTPVDAAAPEPDQLQHALSREEVQPYARRVERMGFRRLRGFLRGFIDLIFLHEGRWYIVDYKSNHLGARWEDYRRDRLFEEMLHHDYLLQYHLYLVGLDRYLRGRLEDYDPNRHLGGVFYLFLRGMRPEYGHSRGVFFDRPPAATLAALNALFSPEGPSASQAGKGPGR